jgi:uncharacterized protein YdhG (YjbR/CyaY superfamily)
MKQATSVPKSVDEYLTRVPEPARSTLGKVRAAIRAAAPPEATEGISYGMPMFRYKGPLVYYAGFRNHCSFFPASGAVIAAFKEELKGYHTSKGTLRFGVDKALPASLLKKMVKARVAEQDRKKKR